MSSSLPAREPSVAEVSSELRAVLDSRVFRQSRGLAKLLRYLCAKALVEDAEGITEYTIAIDVLGKPQDFKESKDSSVRVELHRLRKRLAEFYEQEGAEHAVQILIPAGQYAPQFLARGEAPVAVAEPRVASVARKLYWRAGLAICVAAAVIGLAAWVSFGRRSEPLDAFWRPVLSSPNPILLCIGNMEGGHTPVPPPPDPGAITMLEFHHHASQTMSVSDAVTLSMFTGVLQLKGKPYRVLSQSEATFADLQRGPTVLIGLANNDWTERLAGDLRFSVEHPPGRICLRDRSKPAREDWCINYSSPFSNITKDYALVVRVLDPKTEQMAVTAAGITVFGTLAAGKFLTDPKEFRKIEAVAPPDWRKKNFEIVLSTTVIRGKSGPPNILAAHFW